MKKNTKIAIAATIFTIAGAFSAFANTATDSNATRKEESTSYETRSNYSGNITIGGLKGDLLDNLAGLLGSSQDSDKNADLVEDKKEFNGSVEPSEPTVSEPEVTPEEPVVDPVEPSEPTDDTPTVEPEEPVVEEPTEEPEAPIVSEPETKPEIPETIVSEPDFDDDDDDDYEVVKISVAEYDTLTASFVVEEPEEVVEEIVVPEYYDYELTSLPKTGDDSHLGLTLFAFFVSMLGLIVTTGYELKNH